MGVTKLQVSGVPSAVGGRVDALVCCASFESRCRSVPDIVVPSSVKRVLIAENKNLGEYVGENAAYLRKRFAEAAVDVPLNTGDPIRTADSLRKALEEASAPPGQTWLIDITTFTHESLLILLRLLPICLTRQDCIWFVYVSASEYSVGARDKDKWLSKGVADVRSVEGYPGIFIPSQKTHLVVLVGYERERALGLIEDFEPNLISLGHGRAGTETHDKHRNAMDQFHKLVRESACIHGTVDEFDFSCSDPWDARDAVLKQHITRPDWNTVVAPMNTKISTVGAALAAMSEEKIQLCYAQAAQYNYRQYSAPGEMCALFQLPELFRDR